MTTASLQIDFNPGLGSTGLRTQYLFADSASAAAAFEMLKAAVTAYHARANDRERVITFSHLCGAGAVDVSQIIGFSHEDPLGIGRVGFEEWETGLAEIKAKGKAAAQAVEARRAETTQIGSVEDESAVGNADAPTLDPHPQGEVNQSRRKS